ncbi:MAG TPA: hypothetical protein VGN65_01325 [Casimicrobiaceae bacterium]|jgi:hypothetical protein
MKTFFQVLGAISFGGFVLFVVLVAEGIISAKLTARRRRRLRRSIRIVPAAREVIE